MALQSRKVRARRNSYEAPHSSLWTVNPFVKLKAIEIPIGVLIPVSRHLLLRDGECRNTQPALFGVHVSLNSPSWLSSECPFGFLTFDAVQF